MIKIINYPIFLNINIIFDNKMPRVSFKEFRRIIQGSKLEKRKKKKDWWHSVFTFFSRYITWILVKTPISANFITITGLLIGLTGLLFIAVGNNIFIIIGFVLLYIYYTSDEVDGEVARYRKQTSLRGIYYDEVAHLFFQSWFFFSFSFSIFRINSEFLYIIFGVITTFFLLGIRTVRKISTIAFAKGDFKNISKKNYENNEILLLKKTLLQKIRSIIINLINAFSHTHLTTTVFFIGFLLFFYFGKITVLEIIIICYMIFLLVVFFTFMIMKARSIDKDVLKLNEKRVVSAE
jgi:phosphatidylglycerophosphate synthase